MVPTGENFSVPTTAESCTNCTSSPFDEVDVTKAVVLGLVLVVFVIFGVMGNILVILSVVCHRNLRSVTHFFIANLAAADLLLSSAVMPFSATLEALGKWVFGRTFCNVWAALDVLCCTASIMSLCVISVDRCLAVTYPLRYPAMATERRGLAAVVLLWVLSAVISVCPLFGWKDPEPEDQWVCLITEEPGYALFSALVSFYVPLAIILAMYCRVYVVAKKKSHGLKKGGKKEGSDAGGVMLRIHRGKAAEKEEEEAQEELMKGKRPFSLMKFLKFSREKKAAKTLGIVVGCFVACWLPFFLVLPIGSFFPSCKPSDTVFKVTFWLGYFNSCINPIIYPCFSQEFKKAFQNVLCCRCFRRPGSISRGQRAGSTHSGHGHMVRVPNMCRCCPSSSGKWGCCRTLSDSSSSVGTPEKKHSARVRSKSMLKAWCFTGRETKPPQVPARQGSAKILQSSLGVTGEPV